MKEKTSWADFSRPRTPAIHETVHASVTAGRQIIQDAAASANDPASSANRRARAAEAQRKNAGLIEKMKQGFGHPACNPIARFIPKAS
jgi:hypothetical protein